MVDQVEGGYLGELMEGKHEKFVEMSTALNSGPVLLGGPGPRLTDSMGTPWTAAYIDTLGQPTADLRSDIAAEARAKIVYERLIKLCDDSSCRDTLNFLMTREIAHQKMFEAALAAITPNFPPGNLPGSDKVAHTYVKDSSDGQAAADEGYQLATTASDFGFDLEKDPVARAPETGAL
jgi:Mn-containing catalase